MTPEQWQKIESVLQAALDLPSHERGAFVTDACNGDLDLTREVRTLADAYDESGDFIEAPALESDAEVIFSFGESNVGREVGPYRIVERLGVGGMGEVYLAKDQRLNRSVALKILPGYLSDEARLSRFRKEARAASGLNHPNILTIHEVGEHDDVRFIATEFIEGETLRELITRQALSPAMAMNITEQICAALSAAHSAGIIHRDIKPENIMRRPDGIVKLLDFGIAKLTETPPDASTNHTQTEFGVVMGTVSYMSPEQARGLEVDERSDIWSLGVVLFEMLTSRLPFTRSTRLDTMVAILERAPDPPFPSDNPILKQLKKVTEKCLSKNVNARYQTAAELLVDIKSVKPNIEDLKIEKSTAGSQPTENPTVLVPRQKRGKRSVLTLAAVLTVLMAIATGVAYWRLQSRSVQPAPLAAPAFKLYAAMSDAERLAFIDSQEQRVSALMGERPAKLNADALQAIKTKVDRYVRIGSSPSEIDGSLRAILERARPHLPTIGRSFRERNVPVVVGIYLAMIESGYRTCYESPSGSKGLYQFLPGTAALYGVSREEMCDAEKMTPAAAHYLADRMAELGDDSQSLTLVIFSYTTGPEWVRETLRKLRDTGNYDRTFWTMFDKRESLDNGFQENSYYVPAFFAAAIIGENPAVFGLSIEPLSSLAK